MKKSDFILALGLHVLYYGFGFYLLITYGKMIVL